MKLMTTTAGPIKLITFKQFTKMIARSAQPDKARYVEFNTMVGAPYAFIEDAGIGEEDTSYYERRGAYFIKGDEETILKTALLYRATLGFFFNKPPLALFEDMAVKCMEQWGNPTVMVRLDRRTWLTANPEDFRVYENKNGVALGCFRKSSTNIFQIMPLTEIEAVEASLKMLENFGR